MGFFKRLFGIKDNSGSIGDGDRSVQKEIPVNITITTTFSSGSSSSVKTETFGDIYQDKDGNWILNPGAYFPLTLINATEHIALEVRKVLDNTEVADYRKDDKLVAIFAEHNLAIKEIELYKEKYKPGYHRRIEELINNCKDWNDSGLKDREDLLIDFRKTAIAEIYERANCDLEILFENEPKEINIDDELIKDFGFENIRTYLRYADKMDKIRVVSNDNYNRPIFDRLAEMNLADKGQNLPKAEILTTLTLKELNTIAQKQYKRKNQAIEYLITLENLDQEIGKYISLRELFKLKPLPDKYTSLNLKEIANTWSYHYEEIKLLMDTFRNSYYTWRDLADKKYIRFYKIEPLDKIEPCPCAKDLSEKTFPKNNPPKMPFHIGCNCFLNKEFDFQDA